MMMPGVIHAGFLDDDALAALYGGANAFIFPSLYEGFGLPVLEAMACGTPVLASARTAIPEAGGDSALYFDPADVGEILRALRTGFSEGDDLESLRERGLERAGTLRWEKTRDLVWKILQEARESR
jgi:alpha-1,3-rhamnosyl/mannosyltransferase